MNLKGDNSVQKFKKYLKKYFKRKKEKKGQFNYNMVPLYTIQMHVIYYLRIFNDTNICGKNIF